MSQSQSAATTPMVSIIVPFYNAEATIARCVHSLMRQTSDDFEVIFVNDGSRDNSFAILNEVLVEYPKHIDRSHVLYYTYRQGVAAAHRIGAAHASGEYIMRVDADDELIPNAIKLLTDTARREGADIVSGQFERIYPNKRKVVAIDSRFPDINALPLIVDNYSMCNKIIRRSLLSDNDIEVYPEIDCWDDLTVTARALALSRRTATVDHVVYRYYINPSAKSVSKTNRDTQLRQHLLAALMLEQWFVSRYPDNRYEPFLNRLKLIAKVKYLRGKDKDIQAWKNTFPEVNGRIMGISGVKWYYRTAFWLVANLPTRLCQWIADRCRIFYK